VRTGLTTPPVGFRVTPEAGPTDRVPPELPVRTDVAERNVDAILQSIESVGVSCRCDGHSLLHRR
jgi:hypothetical protein